MTEQKTYKYFVSYHFDNDTITGFGDFDFETDADKITNREDINAIKELIIAYNKTTKNIIIHPIILNIIPLPIKGK